MPFRETHREWGLGTLAQSRKEPLIKTCNRSLEVQSFSGSRAGKNGKIACVLMNAQSLRSKFDEFQCFVALEKPDIICVTETWVSEGFNGDRLQDFEIGGYDLFSYCRETRQGGGVFVYVSSSLCATIVANTMKENVVESVWLDIKTGSSKRHTLRVGAFYRAGNLQKSSQVEIDEHISNEIRRNFRDQCLIMGDFNLRGYENHTEDTSESRMFRQLFEEEFFMQQFVAQPTRHGAILDLVLSDNRSLVTEVEICEGLGNSDHNKVMFNVALENKTKDNNTLVPNFNQADFDGIRHKLAQIDWKAEFSGLDTFESWNLFKNRLSHVRDMHIPYRQRRNRKSKPVWLTKDIQRAIQAKKTAFKIFKNAPLEPNTNAYRIARNKVKREVRASKRAKELDLARHCNKDSKKFFSFYKLGSTTKSIGPLRVNDEVVSRDSEMVEVLNNEFKSVFTIEDESSLASLQPQTETSEMVGEIGTVSRDLVMKYIRKIKPNKAEGPDEIHARLLRECEKEISLPLAMIFSKSLAESKVPLDWKRANVVPIYKKGDKSQAGNYRPVSLTSLACKILESIIKDKIVEFLSMNGLIKDTQHGFRKGRSCLTNLLEFLDIATNSFDEGKQLDVSYLDFSKAFDKVPHKRLVLQLKAHGIRGEVLNWIEQWLFGREQRVMLNGCKSAWKQVISGVPQGSVLGPLLFIIFVNTIENGIDSKVLKFADDVKLFRTIESGEDQDAFQSDLDRIFKWSEDWQMKFNLKKCKIMHTGRVFSKCSYEIDGQILQQTEMEKDLGVIVRNSLSSSGQVVEVRNKALRMLGAVNRNVSYKSEEVIAKLYCAYVRPHLEYCVQAWSPTYEKDCWLLERVQKRATKMIKCLSHLGYEDRLKKLDLFSLKYRRLRGDLIEVFKFIKGMHAGYLQDMFEISKVHRGRGHQHKLVMKQSRTRLRQSFFARRVVGHWNGLPRDIVAADTLEAFKMRLDKHFIGKGLAYEYSWD